MFERLGSLTFRYRYLIVVAWVVAAVGCVALAPSLAAQGMTDQSAFLPAGSASVLARDAIDRGFPGATAASSATLAFERDSGLTDADRRWIEETADWTAGPDAPAALRDVVGTVTTAGNRPELAAMLRSDDGRLEMVLVNLDVAATGRGASAAIGALRDHLAATAPDGLAAHVTGTAGISTDYLASIVSGTESTTAVTVVLVIVILLLIYRAPLAAMVPLVTIGAAFLVARGTLGILAAAGWKVSSLLDTFIVVLVFGVGTDYAIFLISRFREEVARGDWHDASRATVRRIGAVISASAATVIVGLGSMAFADFGMIQTTGPALAVAVFVTLVAGLTLAPALLAIFGHYLFWPLHARTDAGDEPGGLFARLAAAVSHRPGLVTAVILVALLVPAAAASQMQTNFDVLADLPASSDARTGFDAVAAHLGRGKVVQSTGAIDAPGADLLAPASLARLRDVTQALAATDGVAGVTGLLSPDGDGVVPDGFRPSRQLASMADGFGGDGAASGANSGGEALLDASVSDGLSTAAEYLGLLGAAFPDAAAGTAFRSATHDLDAARDEIDGARTGALVSGQLRSLASALASPAAAGGASGGSTSLVGDYLRELAVAHPSITTYPHFAAARAAAAGLERKPSITAALEASAALGALATEVVERGPDTRLFPESLSGTTEVRERRARIEATFDALPHDLDALAAVFAARRDDVFVPLGLSGEPGAVIRDAVDAFVAADRSMTRFYLTTVDDPYAQEAFATIRRAQDVLAGSAPGFGPGAGGYLGGPSAEFADVQAVLSVDFQRVGIVTVIGILVVLVLLLRAVVAPLYLVGTVLLSCATAIGVSSWYFQSVLGQAGVSFYLPLLVFVLLVALGSDYNIFLMSRVREESEHRPIRDGIRVASGRTGAVITSAGLILAGTFGSMATAPLTVLFQVGVAVAIGVLIDTFIVRSILVPAITMLAGDRAWWPFGRHGVGTRVGSWLGGAGVRTGGATGVAASRRTTAIAVALVVAVPLVVAGLFSWSMADPGATVDRVTGAVVDLDEGAPSTGPDGTTAQLTLGADLARQLVTGAGDETLRWVAVGSSEADDGLRAGRYGAVLTIPPDFSARVAAILAGGAATPGKANLRLETDDGSGYTPTLVARSITTAIAASTTRSVTARYVADVLLSVGSARDRLAAASGGAQALASQSTAVSSGADDMSSVAGAEVVGLEALAAGTSAASDGTKQLASGIGSLASGTRRLASGASSLGTGARAAAEGGAVLARGADSLADGLHELSARTARLPGEVSTLDAGAASLADLSAQVADGTVGLAATLDDLAARTHGLGGQARSLDDDASAVATDADRLVDSARASASDARDVASAAHDLQSSIAGYTGSVTDLAAGCDASGAPASLCTQLAEVAAGGGDLRQGASSLAGGADGAADDAGGVVTGARDVRDGTAGVASGTGAFASTAPALEYGIAGAAGAGDTVAAGASRASAGTASLAAGTGALAGSMPILSRAVSDAAKGARSVADGADGLAAGVAKVADGADAIAAGADTAARGASTLRDGTLTAAGGVSRLAAGLRDALDGARIVAANADGLAGRGRTLAGDSGALADKLADDTGSTSVPVGSPDQVGAAVTEPVAVTTERLHAAGTTGSGLVPYFMALALWVGALVIYLVLPAVGVSGDRRRPLAGALAGLATGAVLAGVQVIALVAGLWLGVGVDVAQPAELTAMAVIAALAAVGVTHALVATWGMRGWCCALFLVALQAVAAGAPFPIETAPSLLAAIHPLLPMTWAVEAFRTLIAAGGPPVAPAVAVQLAWGIGAVAVTLVVAARRGGRLRARPVASPA